MDKIRLGECIEKYLALFPDDPNGEAEAVKKYSDWYVVIENIGTSNEPAYAISFVPPD